MSLVTRLRGLLGSAAAPAESDREHPPPTTKPARTGATSTVRSGAAVESRVAALLEREGLVLVARNWRARGGELDLVLLDGAVLVFVEVRARNSARFGGALGSVTAGKQRRVVRAAEQFLAAHPQHGEREMRFDVVSLEADGKLRRLRSAFDAF